MLSLSLLEAGAAIDLLLLLLPLFLPNDVLLAFFVFPCNLSKLSIQLNLAPAPSSSLKLPSYPVQLISRRTRRKPAAGVAYGPRTHRKDSRTKEEPEIKKSRVKPGNETPNLKSVSQKKTSTKKISKTVSSDDDYDYNADAYASENENDLQNLIKGSTQKAKNPKIAMLPKGQKNVTDVVGLFDSENVAENQPPKRAKPETKVQAPLSLPPSKRKTKSTKPAPTTNNDEDVPLAIELTWKELPTHCPAADRLPSQPVDKILSLFNKKKALTKAGGPTAKGVAFTAVEICQAITIQKRRDSVLRLAESTFKMKELDASPVWDQFLLSIDYKLLDFSEYKKKSAFPAAFRAKHCGYYGPQGEFVIYSSLLHLVSELEQVQENLEQDLFLTIHSVVTQVTLDDFIRFFLVPAVATCLILEDYPGFDNSHDALFERSNNDEYGQLFFPEDITEPTVHNIHYQNTLSIRSAQDYRDTEPAPPRHRKLVEVKPEIKTETLKICIPLPAIVEEEEITIDDFSLANTVNTSSYGTCSRSKAIEEEG
ncbi:hypothetical protein B0H13DRAFT_1903143 [Mycena leptocephala]|nr:hypothetical protein B0H13DRAFT_1903143 [Mycena leptocephala]